jgi:hypothetical protein
MIELWNKFLHDMHFVRAIVLGAVSWAGLAMVSPAGRTVVEKLLYTAPVAFGIGMSSISGSNGKKV